MTYGLFPTVRNIGVREAITWTELNTDGYVYIDGYAADFDYSRAHNVYVDIVVDDPGNPATTIEFSPLQTTATDYANKINTSIPGTAEVIDGALRLKNSTYIEVSNIYSNDDFYVIGLPLVSRSKNNTEVTSTIPTINLVPDRFDCLSNPLTINQGSNTVTLWTKLTGNDISDGYQTKSPRISIIWSNGVEGSITGLISIQQLPLDGYELTIDSLDSKTIYYDAAQFYQFVNFANKMNGITPMPVYNRPIVLNVPRGATEMRVLLTNSKDWYSNIRDSNPTKGPPAKPPTIEIYATQGAS